MTPDRVAPAGRVGPEPRRRRGRGQEGGERAMVPPATLTSYYGRPVVRASPWEKDIPAYLFVGGLAGGSSILAAGADLTGRRSLRRTSRIGALAAIGVGYVALIHDLGRPERFLNMLRVAKPTSPMSVGTWIVTAYGPLAALAAVDEVAGLVPRRPRWFAPLVAASARPAGIAAAGLGAGLASYTAVLLADTATPTWHDAQRHLPFAFVGSAASAAGGLGMLGAPVAEAGPARRMAAGGALLELSMAMRMEASMGITAQPLHTGRAGTLMTASKILTAVGATGAVLLAGHNRLAAAGSGLALLAGSACTRFGIFEAGQASARDPRYTIVPQRERLSRRRSGGG